MQADSIMASLRILSDFPTLERFAAVLWQQDNAYHGAAVMVGAGFSRSSATTGDVSKKLPLWFNFSEILSKGLKIESSNIDPLRIAEEYSAFFGRQALDDLLKKEINDSAWEPSEIHNDLLELPWTEVLTTNWDTLLEKASEKTLERFYNVVYRQEDLSSAHSPRIVKLHGTVNLTKELVFTQEDYRKYPQKHAAYVNFARQVFIENELCLIGFSGDDPNFLQWTGWVRDHLASNARRIYLVGALNLTAAKRKYLESINIAPIDLEPLVSDFDEDLKHKKATEIFLEALKKLEPKRTWEWQPSSLDRKLTLEEKLPVLKKDRETYPGWLILPDRLRWQLEFDIDKESLMALTEETRAEILYEIVWRHERTYEASQEWLIQEMFKECDLSKSSTLTKRQQLEVAVHVLKNTRWLEAPVRESLEKESIKIIENYSQYWSESLEEVAFYKASLALHKLDYEILEDIVKDIIPKDPINKLRKAALLGELGLFDEGGALISEGHKELLNQYRKDPHSIYILSRLKVSERIQNVITLDFKQKMTDNGKEKFCELWDQIDSLRSSIRDMAERKKKGQGIKVLFTPGRYINNSKNHTFYNGVHPWLVFHGMLFSSGVPIRWDHVGFMTGIAQDLIYFDEISREERFSLVIRTVNSEKDDEVEHVFSRLQMASISQEESEALILKCENAIKYWFDVIAKKLKSRDIIALTKLRVFIEVLARISVRSTTEEATKLYNFALEIAQKENMQDVWLYDSLRHLIEYTLKAIPERDHSSLLLKTLEFPLVTELQGKPFLSWPNPIIEHVGDRNSDTGLDKRINQLIEKVTHPESGRLALQRLLPLIKCNFLNSSELDKLAVKIWGDCPNLNDLPNVGLYNWVFLILPSKNQEDTKNLVRDYLFKADSDKIFNEKRLINIISAAKVEYIRQLPDEQEAKNYFDLLVGWRKKLINESDVTKIHRGDNSNNSLIAQALSCSVIPALSKMDLNEENFEKLSVFFKETNLAESLSGFPYFADALEEKVDVVEKLIRNSLLDSNSNLVTEAASAIFTWCDLNKSDAAQRLISLMISIINYNQSPSMFHLLWTANKMVLKSYLSDSERMALSESVPRVFDSMSYNRSFTNDQVPNVSLIRKECVTLAINLLKTDNTTESSFRLSRIVEEAKSDPLPEVRFAAEKQ